MAEDTALDNSLGIYQGRLKPTLAAAHAGSYVWSLGFNADDRAEQFAFGDYIEITNNIDVTDLTFLTAKLLIKQPRSLISTRDFSAGASIIGATSSQITAILPASGGFGPRITTAAPHYLLVGDRVVIGNVVWMGLPAIANQRLLVKSIISTTQFELDAPATGSGVYGGGGSLGLQDRIYSPAGFTSADIGRYVVVSGASNPNNNGTYRITGIFTQPGLTTARQAWVQRPGGALVHETKVGTPGLTITGKGARWKSSLHVHDGVSLREMARVVQKHTQSPFYRADLKAYVRNLTGVRQFTVRATLIESATSEIYTLPP